MESLRLKNYRNYKHADLKFSKGLNVIQGDNAQGKTNLIESIYICAIGKSFRTSRDKDLVKMEENQAFVHLEIKKAYTDMIIDFRLNSRSEKEVYINKQSLLKRSELFGAMYVVLFSPEDLRLVKEGPAQRRQFIDREMSQISSSYYQLLIDYTRVLHQRNKVLKQAMQNRSIVQTLPVWNEKLAEKGTKIILKRQDFIFQLGKISQNIHKGITEGQENLDLIYLSNISKQRTDDYDTIYSEFLKRLQSSEIVDLKRGYTSVGPHRDDLGLYANEVDIRQFGSQGQQRTVALSLKLSEIELIQNETGDTPILLLDDVMSELDEKRQGDLIKSTRGVQTIITATDVRFLSKQRKEKAFVFSVKNGCIASPFFV